MTQMEKELRRAEILGRRYMSSLELLIIQLKVIRAMVERADRRAKR